MECGRLSSEECRKCGATCMHVKLHACSLYTHLSMVPSSCLNGSTRELYISLIPNFADFTIIIPVSLLNCIVLP